jgi:purine-nucleoside phosphorylase
VKAPKVLEHIKPAHIACTKEDIAPIVVMPGDPLRAKYIAENFLSEAKLVSDTRNMFIYTGFYKGTRVTVMGSGMGMPSMSIYAFELFYFFGVEKIIRVGTCGGLIPELDIPDIIIADSSYNEGNFAYSYNGDPTHLVYPSRNLNQIIIDTAKELNLHVTLGTVMSTEQFGFYSDNEHVLARIPKNIHVIGEEMESFALFHIANSFDKQASCILTVVDSKFSEKFMSQEDRERSLNESITLALESIIK